MLPSPRWLDRRATRRATEHRRSGDPLGQARRAPRRRRSSPIVGTGSAPPTTETDAIGRRPRVHPSIRTVRNRGTGSNGVRSSCSRDSCWRTAGYGDRRTHRASGPGQQPGGNRARSPPSSRRRGRRRGVCTAEPGPSVRIVFVGSRRHRSGPHLRPLRHSTAESPPTQGHSPK